MGRMTREWAVVRVALLSVAIVGIAVVGLGACDSSSAVPAVQDGGYSDASVFADAEAGAPLDAAVDVGDAAGQDADAALDSGQEDLDAGVDAAPGLPGKVMVVHAALGTGELQVSIDGGSPLAPIAFTEVTPYTTIEAGSHQLIVTAVAGGAIVATTTVFVVDGQAFTVFVKNAERPALTDGGVAEAGPLSTVVAADPLTPVAAGQSRVRFAYMSPDGSELSVGSEGTTWFYNVIFPQITEPRTVAAGTVPVEVLQGGYPVDLPENPTPFVLESEKVYTLLLVGHIDVGEPRPTLHLISHTP